MHPQSGSSHACYEDNGELGRLLEALGIKVDHWVSWPQPTHSIEVQGLLVLSRTT